MKRIKLIVGVVVCISLIGAIVYGLNTKGCWKNDVQIREYIDDGQFNVDFLDFQANDTFKTPGELGTFYNLFQDADVIVRVSISCNDRREQYTESIITEAQVMETYKGNCEEEIIDIIEPFYMNDIDGEDRGTSIMGYIPMEDNCQYIVFLYKREYKGYGKNYVYIPTTTSISKYKYDINTNNIIGQANICSTMYNSSPGMYNEFRLFDMVSDNQILIDFYNNNVNEIRNLLNK